MLQYIGTLVLGPKLTTGTPSVFSYRVGWNSIDLNMHNTNTDSTTETSRSVGPSANIELRYSFLGLTMMFCVCVCVFYFIVSLQNQLSCFWNFFGYPTIYEILLVCPSSFSSLFLHFLRLVHPSHLSSSFWDSISSSCVWFSAFRLSVYDSSSSMISSSCSYLLPLYCPSLLLSFFFLSFLISFLLLFCLFSFYSVVCFLMSAGAFCAVYRLSIGHP